MLFLLLGIALVALSGYLDLYLLLQAWTPLGTKTGAFGHHQFCPLDVLGALLPSQSLSLSDGHSLILTHQMGFGAWYRVDFLLFEDCLSSFIQPVPVGLLTPQGCCSSYSQTQACLRISRELGKQPCSQQVWFSSSGNWGLGSVFFSKTAWWFWGRCLREPCLEKSCFLKEGRHKIAVLSHVDIWCHSLQDNFSSVIPPLH